jgi:3-oxoadipate enol-lactonase
MPELVRRGFSRRDWLKTGSRAATAMTVAAVAGSSFGVEVAQGSPAQPQIPADAGTVGQAITLASGLQVHYKEDWFGEPWTSPETVLFLHGNLELGDVWYGWVPRMGQHFRLLRPDLPGFGRSTAPQDFEWTLAHFATVMANFLDKAGVTSAHVIGAKTGGAIAMQFAAMFPQKTKTVVVASGPFAPVDPKFENSSQKVRLGSSATDDEIAYFDKLRAAMRPQTRAGMAKLLTGINLDDVLTKIQAPTLIITSDHSALQTVESVLQHQPRIANSRLLVVTSDAYHVAVANAEECASNALAFIRDSHRG